MVVWAVCIDGRTVVGRSDVYAIGVVESGDSPGSVFRAAEVHSYSGAFVSFETLAVAHTSHHVCATRLNLWSPVLTFDLFLAAAVVIVIRPYPGLIVLTATG